MCDQAHAQRGQIGSCASARFCKASERRPGRFVSARRFSCSPSCCCCDPCDAPTHTKAQQCSASAQRSRSADSELWIALVQTWALQISKPMRLRPVTITIKVWTAMVSCSPSLLSAGGRARSQVAARTSAGGRQGLLSVPRHVRMRRACARHPPSAVGWRLRAIQRGFFGSLPRARTPCDSKGQGLAMAGEGGCSERKSQAGVGRSRLGTGTSSRPGGTNRWSSATKSAPRAEDMRAIDQLEASRKRKSRVRQPARR